MQWSAPPTAAEIKQGGERPGDKLPKFSVPRAPQRPSVLTEAAGHRDQVSVSPPQPGGEWRHVGVRAWFTCVHPGVCCVCGVGRCGFRSPLCGPLRELWVRANRTGGLPSTQPPPGKIPGSSLCGALPSPEPGTPGHTWRREACAEPGAKQEGSVHTRASGLGHGFGHTLGRELSQHVV